MSTEGAQELNRVEPDAAATDHQGGVAGLDLSGIFHRVIRCGHTAADDARLVERQPFRQLENHVARQGEILCKAADVPAIYFLSIGSLQRRRRRPGATEIFPAGDTILAVSATISCPDDHRVTRLKCAALAAADV